MRCRLLIDHILCSRGQATLRKDHAYDLDQTSGLLSTVDCSYGATTSLIPAVGSGSPVAFNANDTNDWRYNKSQVWLRGELKGQVLGAFCPCSIAGPRRSTHIEPSASHERKRSALLLHYTCC